MPDDTIQYDVLAREALRHVVREVLELAATEGLPGEHHFFITFRTDVPGVEVGDQLKADFPEEMTIVLQHQFWDLDVQPDHFSVKLAFGGVPRELRVPYKAISAFFDPSVQFGLQFAPLAADSDGDEETSTVVPNDAAESAGEDGKPAADETGEVVSLDAFRKK